MSVARCMREVDSAEFSEWIAYYHLEPFGDERADLRAAIIAHTNASVMRGKKSKPYKLKDFMASTLIRQRGRVQQTPEQMMRVLEMRFPRKK